MAMPLNGIKRQNLPLPILRLLIQHEQQGDAGSGQYNVSTEQDQEQGNARTSHDGTCSWWRRNWLFRKRMKGSQLLNWIKDLNMKRTTGKLLAERVRKFHCHFRMMRFLKDMHTQRKER